MSSDKEDRSNDSKSELDSDERVEPDLLIFNPISGDITFTESTQPIRDIVILDPNSWKITKFEIYTIHGMPIFSANYSSSISDFDSSLVLQFYKTVEKFAETNLKTRFVDFKVGQERILFRVAQDNIYIVSTKLGNEVQSGLSSEMYVTVSALITDISSLLFFQNSQDAIENDHFTLQDSLNEMINSVNENASSTSNDFDETTDLDISYAVITDEFGIPFLSRTYDSSNFKDDPMLLSMFLHALNVFFNTNFSDDLNEINFGNSRLYIKNFNSNFYAIMVQFGDFINLHEDSDIHRLSFQILDQMQKIVSDFAEDIELVSEDDLQLIVDNFIFKAQFELNS